MNKEVYLKTADIYLRFPEIMEEECDDLAEFLEDENIVYEGATDVFIEKDKEIERLNKECDTYMKIATKKDNIINELEKWLNIQQNISSPEQIINDIFDKIKELKEGEKND